MRRLLVLPALMLLATGGSAVPAGAQSAGALTGTISVVTTWTAGPAAAGAVHSLEATCQTTLRFAGSDSTQESSTFEWVERIVERSARRESTRTIERRGSVSRRVRGVAVVAAAGADRYVVSYPRAATFPATEVQTLTTVVDGRQLPPPRSNGVPRAYNATCFTPQTPPVSGNGVLSGRAERRVEDGFRPYTTAVEWQLSCARRTADAAAAIGGSFPVFQVGTAPSGTAPSGTAPSGTAPSGTAPAGTAPAGTEECAPPVSAAPTPDPPVPGPREMWFPSPEGPVYVDANGYRWRFRATVRIEGVDWKPNQQSIRRKDQRDGSYVMVVKYETSRFPKASKELPGTYLPYSPQ